jgi:hypothetical protein
VDSERKGWYLYPGQMELIVGSETSENQNMTPGKYPKEHIQYFYLSAVVVCCTLVFPMSAERSPDCNYTVGNIKMNIK